MPRRPHPARSRRHGHHSRRPRNAAAPSGNRPALAHAARPQSHRAQPRGRLPYLRRGDRHRHTAPRLQPPAARVKIRQTSCRAHRKRSTIGFLLRSASSENKSPGPSNFGSAIHDSLHLSFSTLPSACIRPLRCLFRFRPNRLHHRIFLPSPTKSSPRSRVPTQLRTRSRARSPPSSPTCRAYIQR